MTRSLKQNILKTFFIVYLFALTVLAGKTATLSFETEALAPPFYFLPKVEFLSPALCGFDEVAADLLWIRGLGYFADEFVRSGPMTMLEPLAHLITDLDPRFEKVYIWGGTLLIYNGKPITKNSVEASNRILKKGINVLRTKYYWPAGPSTWRLPFMLGFNYYHELKDRLLGAKYFLLASTFPYSPSYLKTLPAALLRREGKTSVALEVAEINLMIDILKGRLALTENEEERKRLMGYILFLLKKLGKSKAVLKNIEEKSEQMASMLADYKKFNYIPFGQFILIK